MFRKYLVTIEVTVTDSDALLTAARNLAVEKNCADLVSEINSEEDALVWLLDQGSDWQKGYEIDNSSAEYVRAA